MSVNARTTGRRRTALWRRTLAVTAVMAATGSIIALTPATAQAALPAQSITDPVHYWNDVLQNVFRKAGGGPVPMARAAAMMNAAIYDAESSYQLKWKGRMTSEQYIHAENYAGFSEGPDEEERVIGRTAYNILLNLYGVNRPNKNSTRDWTAYLDERFNQRFGTSPTSFDLVDITVVGKMVNQMMAKRAGDGSDTPLLYNLDNEPGAWRPTGGDYPDMLDDKCDDAAKAVNPYWGQVAPFSLTSGSQFRPTRLGQFATYANLVASPEYKAQVEAVRTAGAAAPTTATPVINRTPDQFNAAWFWANDNDGTYKPPGHMLQATREVSKARGLTVYQNARLFALVSIALADTGIAVRDAKFATPIDLWRPVSAIREGGLDPQWKPLLKNSAGVNVNPCFPAYVSGHASFGAAWAGVMKRYFGSDNLAFDLTTDEPLAPVKTRHFTSFSAAAKEDADSRVWLGVHFPWDATDGLALGEKVADQVFTTQLRTL
ncbi:vanadium-dependent haloperoxidase [Streptomyces sp. H34-S4]|uniref:vanadium-dependent haloperoxidase n=1 Tax=Streptomyces sp. H34-S4 TaxID=2996463 RepID=UPI0022708D2B|nr:vanadium-dependent haloperoxidase [Streptomyces sp. H34-S4]MCY0933139.1 vanadium-dependent haloperoxidase [Streptomyces sp. H34-S4]